jgi:hypothetical protein
MMGSGKKRIKKNCRARHRRNHLVIPPGGSPTLRKGWKLSLQPFFNNRAAAQFYEIAAAAPRLLACAAFFSPHAGRRHIPSYTLAS